MTVGQTKVDLFLHLIIVHNFRLVKIPISLCLDTYIPTYFNKNYWFRYSSILQDILI